MPTEKEFEHLEWLLKNYYKKQSNSDEDCISREAFITRYREWSKSEYGKIPSDDALGLRVAKSLPSIQPKPNTGHWKRISIDKYSQHAMYWYRCDRCGEDNLGNTDWCPNCGAKMESEDKE